MKKKILFLLASVIIFSAKNSAACSVSISVSPNDTVCTGTSVTFTPAVLVTCATHYIDWYVNGVVVMSASSTTPVPFTLNNPQNGDSVSCQVACNPFDICYSNAIVMTVVASVTPAVSIFANPDTICDPGCVIYTASPVNGGSSPVFQWYVDAVPIPAGVTPIYTDCNLLPGVHNVYITMNSSLTCANPMSVQSNTVQVVVQVCTGTEENNFGSAIHISPNPNYGLFEASLRSSLAEPSITVANYLGEIIYKQKVTGKKAAIDLRNHPAGIYFVRVMDGKNIHAVKKIQTVKE